MKKHISTTICMLMCVLLFSLTLSACERYEQTQTPTINTETSVETEIQTEPVTSTQQQSENSVVSDTEPSDAIENCTDEILFKKPVIYLYPEKATRIIVTLGYPQKATCTYPEYKGGWDVTAYPNGTLIDNKTGRELYSLYWEGNCEYKADLNEGFVVKGDEVIEFLEEKLTILGLSEKEAEEFIIYWLPILQENEYNYIRFATIDEINSAMPLELSENPDTLIRVLMQYKPLSERINVTEQKLNKATRTGFTVVEWGGCEIR